MTSLAVASFEDRAKSSLRENSAASVVPRSVRMLVTPRILPTNSTRRLVGGDECLFSGEVDLSVLDNDFGDVGCEWGVEEHLRPNPPLEGKVIVVLDALRGRAVVVVVHDLGDHVGGGLDAHRVEFDHEIIKRGVFDIGVEDLPAPPPTVFVGVPDMALRLFPREAESVHRGLEPELHRGPRSVL